MTNSKPPAPQLLTSLTVAALFAIESETIQQWVLVGGLAFHVADADDPGGAWKAQDVLFDPVDVRAFVQGLQDRCEAAEKTNTLNRIAAMN